MNRRFRIVFFFSVIITLQLIGNIFEFTNNRGIVNESQYLPESSDINDGIEFINPELNGKITKKYNYTINVTVDDVTYPTPSTFKAQIRIFSTNPSTPELDWTDMNKTTGQVWNHTFDPVGYAIYSSYNFTIRRWIQALGDWIVNTTLININWLENDSITFVNPQPSEFINQTTYYNINVSVDVAESTGNAELRIFSDNVSDPELNWTAMTQNGNIWNYSINFTTWTPYLTYNFSVRMEYAPSEYFINSTIVAINCTTANSSSGNGNGDNGEDPPIDPPDDNPNGNGDSIDPMLLLIIAIIGVMALSVFFVVKKKGGKDETKGKWFEEIREKNSEKFDYFSEYKPKDKLSIKARSKERYDSNGNGKLAKAVKEAKTNPRPHKLKPVEYKQTQEPSEADLRELEKTESEMEVMKPKHICIVHKGRIDGKIYICPECQTVYCTACAELLRIKGDTCWSCKNPITL